MNTYKVNTGHEAALEREVARLKELLIEREDKWDALMRDKLALVAHGDKLLDENGDLEERNDASKATIQRLKDEVTELEKAYKDECHETQVYKKAWREQRELVALRDDQIAMLERKLTKREEDKN
jgi:small-conductance mechanosensitive channel|tara:strand:+ start:153 stop:527 length:375 start_codon:yes stop_codon:yes gene_type:complete